MQVYKSLHEMLNSAVNIGLYLQVSLLSTGVSDSSLQKKIHVFTVVHISGYLVGCSCTHDKVTETWLCLHMLCEW